MQGRSLIRGAVLAVAVLVPLLAGAAARSGAAVRDPNTFPSFEPFLASRMWEPVFGSPTALPDARSAAERIDQLVDKIRAQSRADPLRQGRRAPVLSRKITERERSACSMIPWAVLQLRPLWERETWGENELRLIRSVSRLIRLMDSDFTTGSELDSPAAVADALERIVEWYRVGVHRSEVYGYMIFTMDEGPWKPVPQSRRRKVEVVDRRALDAAFSLELGRTNDGSWCLRGVDDGDAVWTAVLSEVPKTTLRFSSTATTPLGPHGWKIHLTTGDYVHLYLDRDRRPLFYFTEN